jgi:hypothetical protein
LHSTPEAIEATAAPGGAKAGNTTTDDRRKDEALVLVQGDEEAALRCHEARLAQELAQVERRKTELRLERLETSLREVSLCRELAGVLRLGCCMMNGKKRKEKVHTDTQSMKHREHTYGARHTQQQPLNWLYVCLSFFR